MRIGRAALALFLLGCNRLPLGGGDADPAGPSPRWRDLDVLFMLDSAFLEEEQRELRNSFPAFIDELGRSPGGLPNLHLGVASSDLGAGPTRVGNCSPGGDRGVFATKPNCDVDAGARFLVSADGGTTNNFRGDIAEVFSCWASVGSTGCGFEHPLQAIRLALDESITKENAGFLRPDAFLAIFLLTDEDDCSAPPDSTMFTRDLPGTVSSWRCAYYGHLCNGMMPPIDVYTQPLASCRSADGGELIKVSEIVASIKALKRRPDQQILASGIFGWPLDPAAAQYRYVRSSDGVLDYQGTCINPITYPSGGPTPALRIKEFVDSFGPNGSHFPMCVRTFRPAMKELAAALGRLMQP